MRTANGVDCDELGSAPSDTRSRGCLAPAADIVQEQGPGLRKSEICLFMHNFQIPLWKDVTGRLTRKPEGWLQPGASRLQPQLKGTSKFPL